MVIYFYFLFKKIYCLYFLHSPPLWSSGQEFLPTDPEVPGSVLRPYQIL
jgi:hypothetical protein